jgi:hypothetical protein
MPRFRILTQLGWAVPVSALTVLKIGPSLAGARSTRTAQQVVQFLRDSGFTKHQVRKMITRAPGIVTLNVDWQLKPKIEFMKTLGFTAQDLGMSYLSHPEYLTAV